MRLGLDFRPALLGDAGIARCTRELCRALVPRLAGEDRLALFAVAHRRADTLATGPDRTVTGRTVTDRTGARRSVRGPSVEARTDDDGPGGMASSYVDALLAEGGDRVRLIEGRLPNRVLTLLGRLGLTGADRFCGALDLFLYTDFVYPPLKRTPHALVLYDLLFLEEASRQSRAFRKRMTRRVTGVLKRARGVIVPSHAVADALGRAFPDFRGAVRVIPLGGDHLNRFAHAGGAHASGGGPRKGACGVRDAVPEAASGEGATPPYFLSVGTFEPRKNHAGLLKAFEGAAKDLGDTRLVLAGRPGWRGAAFERALAASPVRRRVRRVENVSDDELAALYRGARALVYPSLGEGFGLPVAEAMALGCPVITSSVSALPEVAGGAARLVDPTDPEALAGALVELHRDEALRASLRARGLKRAGTLTWARTAEMALEFLRGVGK